MSDDPSVHIDADEQTPPAQTPQAGLALDQEQPAAPKVDGRTRAARAARGEPRTVTRAGPRTEERTSARGEYIGRNGEILTRSLTTMGDEFEVPPHLKERGWDYQWLTEHIYNNPDIVRKHSHAMYQTGWRPVLAVGKWNGVYGPKADTGHIRVGDSGLYERPMQMSIDARKDDQRKAVTQMRDRDQALMGGRAAVRGALGEGLAMGPKYRGTGGDIRMQIDPGLDAPLPSYAPADDTQP